MDNLGNALVLWIKEPNPKSRDSISNDCIMRCVRILIDARLGSPNKQMGSTGNSEITNYISLIKQAVRARPSFLGVG